jgi:hypothetical protein
MPSSGTWCRVGLVRTDVSEERITSIVRIEKIRERRKALAVDHISEGGILNSHSDENLKSRKEY